MVADPSRVAETSGWLAKAAKDLATAAYEFEANPPFLEDIVFHAQQAVEKTLKGFLTWHDRPFRKTHDLVEIGRSCVEVDASLEAALRQAAPLTEYAWKFRYPGELEEPTREEAESALALARQVWQAIVSRLPGDVRP